MPPPPIETGARPAFLISNKPARVVQRLYHGHSVPAWEGLTKIDSIKGWVENPRIQLEARKYRKLIGDRELTQKEVQDLMLGVPEFKLRILRDDILQNGLRIPLILNFEGKLIDGNRRFFALKSAIDNFDGDPLQKASLQTIPVFVLTPEADEEVEMRVLVEENFAPSLKVPWDFLVQADYVVKDAAAGMSHEKIAAKYQWKTKQVQDTLKIDEIVQDYLGVLTAEPDFEDDTGGGMGLSYEDAQLSAAKNYQYFNEAQKSFFRPLRTEPIFKLTFFRWVYDGKFTSFPEVRLAYQFFKRANLRSILESPSPSAAKDAKATHDYIGRSIKTEESMKGEMDGLIKFLEDLKVKDLAVLPMDLVVRLRSGLEKLVAMAEAVQTAGPQS